MGCLAVLHCRGLVGLAVEQGATEVWSGNLHAPRPPI